jgi:Fe-S cluster assembly protein SufD
LITATEKHESWLKSFEHLEKEDAPAWLRSLRQAAFARFWELGFPTTHDEDWRFTNVAPIANTVFTHAADVGCPTLVSPDFGETGWGFEGAAARLVFVNGRFSPELSQIGSLPKGVVVASLREAPSTELERHLAHYEDFKADAFTALNTAFLDDGAYLSVPRGTVLEAPIHLLYVTVPQVRGAEGGANLGAIATHPRNLLLIGDSAEAQVVEDYVSLGSGVAFSNAVTELVVGESAVLSHYMVEREDRQALNVSTLRIQQARSANVSSHSVLLGGGLVRNNVHPVLAGEGGECLINGLFMGTGHQHLDNYMKVEHLAPHCESRQFYNGILDEQAHGVFHGRIIVHKDAQKTDAKQTNRNLLLSDSAQIDTKPQLEIYADDVKCTHGATIGQIDETALFYLRSRGLDESQARGLLLYAFAHESLDRMKPGIVRTWLERLVTEALPTSASKLMNAKHTKDAEEKGRNWQEVG